MENKKPRINPYQALINAYEQELLTIDPDACPNIHNQIRIEIRRLREGVIDTVDLLSNKKIKLRTKVDFPVEQYPNVNFPGKVIGPAGKTLKDLQESTKTRMSVLGSGSMRNPEKEIELIQSGDPRFHHLTERIHLQVDCLSDPFDAFEKMSKALIEIKKIITPEPDEVAQTQTPFTWSEISNQQQSMGRGMPDFGNHFPPGPHFEMGSARGGGGRGGRGSFRGSRGGQFAPGFNGGPPPFGADYEQASLRRKARPRGTGPHVEY